MKISTLLTLFPPLMPASVLADTVLYTDSHHLPTNTTASITVIYLDAPERLQAQLFGQLSPSPDKAARQAQAIIQSPQWQAHQQQLVMAWRGVIRAQKLGIRKVPAVVFDDKDVVYGTADVAHAIALHNQAQGGQ